MAIVQISRITNRKGYQENLPQLAGAELGWSIDERRLFIGNGTLQEGAPVIGNTEILTEFSDILNFTTNYTYKGEAAGYVVQTGPTAGSPVTQSLQSWLDQFATVKDFGAVGDGVTDDTAAINRALFQLFCREVNPQVRRSLFFPGGVYRVTETILIPPYATLYGEGINNSVIVLDNSADDSTLNAYVARTTDSLQQFGVNIGNSGAITPRDVTVLNLGFQNLDPTTSVFLVEDASNCSFQNVSFTGPLTTAQLTTDGDQTTGVDFIGTPSLICEQIVFDGCQFGGTVYGMSTEFQTKGITVSNSKFDTHYQAIVLGATAPVNGGPTGFKILHNLFDSIYAEGIVFGNIGLNATGHNIFYDVGNHFQGVLNPFNSNISFDGDNNVSLSDMFARADAQAVTYPRININQSQSIAMTNSKQLQLGTLNQQSGLSATLTDNTAVPTTILTSTETAFEVFYKINRVTSVTTGTLVVTNIDGVGLSWNNNYVENAVSGVVLSVTQAAGTVSVQYTTTSTGVNANFSYSVRYQQI